MTEPDKIKSFLENKRGTVIRRWLDAVLATYSQQAVGFMRNQKDQFANPVGSTFKAGLERLYDEFTAGLDPERAMPHLDAIVRIRAVQEFLPSDALAFVVQLKEILRREAGRDLDADHWAELDNRVDRMALQAFDLYNACRERIHQIRVQEIERNNYMLLRRSGMVACDPEEVERPKQ